MKADDGSFAQFEPELEDEEKPSLCSRIMAALTCRSAADETDFTAVEDSIRVGLKKSAKNRKTKRGVREREDMWVPRASFPVASKTPETSSATSASVSKAKTSGEVPADVKPVETTPPNSKAEPSATVPAPVDLPKENVAELAQDSSDIKIEASEKMEDTVVEDEESADNSPQTVTEPEEEAPVEEDSTPEIEPNPNNTDPESDEKKEVLEEVETSCDTDGEKLESVTPSSQTNGEEVR